MSVLTKATPTGLLPTSATAAATATNPASRWDAVAVVHTAAATGVLGLGAAMLLMRKGTTAHRYMGRVCTGAMLTTCFSSFGIRDANTGQLSWIHGLSTLTICTIGTGVYSIRKQNVRAHMRYMKGSYAIAVASGVFAVATPGRRLYEELFGEADQVDQHAA